MLAILPFIALGCFVGAGYARFPSWGFKKSFLRGSVAWGVYLVLSTEFLSIAHWLTAPALAGLWMVPPVALIASLPRLSIPRGLPKPFGVKWPRSAFSRACLIIIALVVLVTSVIAWVAPPNTYDSLTYHMSRVAHWAQNGSIGPFATGILRQAYMSPGAEMIVLHLYVLAGGDRLANFAEWFAMIACIIGAAKIAADLGATDKGQWMAGLFVATLPMGIAQASSTMTDYIVAWWVVCAAAEVSESLTYSPKPEHIVVMGSAAGLALVTKPTGAVFLAPFAVIACWMLVRNFRPEKAFLVGVVGVASILLLNAGYISRNLWVFGGPFGSPNQAGMFTNEILSWRVVLSNVLRNASLHAGTSWDWLNDQLYWGLAKVHVKLGLGLDDPRTSWHDFFAVRPPEPAENSIGNTWQAALAVLGAGTAVVKRSKRNKALLEYLALVSGSFVIFNMVFKFDMLGSRYHMPFFVLLAPVVGASLSTWRNWLQWPALVLLAISAFQPLLFLQERPLLASDGNSSILAQPREHLYLRGISPADVYAEFTARIQESGCSSIGLSLRGDTPEYPIWVLMGAPRNDLVFDWIIARGDPTGNLRRAGFHPCAVICQHCPATRAPFNDLPWVSESQGFQLYLQEEETH
ncbi:MAG: 2 protein [Anaerolineales bacterium]|nr:2 protein [Anaerolineales bacterium]